MKTSNFLLAVAGGFSFAVALFQAVVSFSPSWSAFFGAPEELVSNPALLLLAGLVFAGIFAGFGFYAFSGAGMIRPLPFLRSGLLAIGAIYTLRGLIVIPFLLVMISQDIKTQSVPMAGLAPSWISLFIGVTYLTGTAIYWRNQKSER